MEHENRSSSGAGYRVVTPAFPGSEKMSAFYAEAHRVIEENFRKVGESRTGGMMLADYAIAEEADGAVEVTLRLRMRLCGRITWEKTVSHRWKGGYIAAGEKRRKKKSRP